MIYAEKIGIVGLGFVGNAIKTSYEDPGIELALVDPSKGFTDTYDDLKSCSGVFVCVPSPQGYDGSCDTSILESVLDNLKTVDYNGVIISKVTAPPHVYARLQKTHKNLVHAPEFLTAANAIQDYRNGRFCFIGGEVQAYRNEAERIIRLGQRGLNSVMHCSIQEASLAKYTINSFLATKVVFMNEMASLGETSDCDWDKIKRMISQDNRIGITHLQVPGPDGSYGFGGACFPKDTSALLKFADDLKQQMTVLEAAVKQNTLLRLK